MNNNDYHWFTHFNWVSSACFLLKAAQKDYHLTYEYSTKPQLLLTRWSEARGTPLLQPHRITLDSLINTLAPAAERSLQRLIQALFRDGLLRADALEYENHHRCR
ncbi:hypothetical protein RGV33_18340 [Pseudomonas sp. Bout1]|uniref:hypothetical protein n=1 Tax=Pseudomonas sp. Bout1 TaxID=3048600 RepID=UPI002AB47B0C|nr:hypothetical protein [Pseudomonas sp. Bout1]MDY7533622.1 hypothetical protein [Pseudomonas sp. Bout1]